MGDALPAGHGTGNLVSFHPTITLTEPVQQKLQPALGASLKVVKDLELFEKWHQRGDIALTHTELAELVPCDALLLRKFPQCLRASFTSHAS